VAEFQQRAGQALSDVQAAFDQVVDEIADRRDTLETEGADAVTAFDAAGDDIDADARALGGELEALHLAWVPQVEAESQDLADSMEDLLAELSSFVDTASDEALEGAVSAVLDGGFEPYLSELTELQAAVDGAEAAAADALLPLVDELERAAAVIETIDNLLDTLES
jgi:hypothetical protein